MNRVAEFAPHLSLYYPRYPQNRIVYRSLCQPGFRSLCFPLKNVQVNSAHCPPEERLWSDAGNRTEVHIDELVTKVNVTSIHTIFERDHIAVEARTDSAARCYTSG